MVYELPPFRPPSEAYSMLLRVTRGCPWNRCKFCGMYKMMRFETRSVEEVKADIDAAREFYGDRKMNVFIGDADSPVIKTDDFVEILRYLRSQFTQIQRVTSYGRAKTLALMAPDKLKRLAEAGLDRLHLGLETGDPKLLQFINKGSTPEHMIKAGRKVKAAGIELSEYLMLGLGGADGWESHARESAAVLNAIDPDFIRVRTTSLIPDTPLFEAYEKGEYKPPTILDMLMEERLLIECLEGIHSEFHSDHVSNFVPVFGKFMEDKPEMLKTLDAVIERLEKNKDKLTNEPRIVTVM
ncbi:MAG: radical SAM protein [Candidatus Abyssobacteria bacterium SURF_17]|uniref:Radical SAM protein n=1 Tax=Candidatus Abyssobacteria bacterium SURF_17 TaxID=2093361 RepID=A0A419EQJ3_9BACT|nr:MAG: radical SAM protein [Candidatus Abyssubacteria bacterium SURF_17]